MKKFESIEKFIMTLDHGTMDENQEALLLTGGLSLAGSGDNTVAQCGCTVNNNVEQCGCNVNIVEGCGL